MIEKLKMISKERIIEIKDLGVKTECTDLDYKEVFNISDSKSKIEFVKDLCAFANSKGGYLIFGVTNNFEWIGLDERSDEKIDDAIIGNVIDEYVCGTIEFLCNVIEIDKSTYIAIYISIK